MELLRGHVNLHTLFSMPQKLLKALGHGSYMIKCKSLAAIWRVTRMGTSQLQAIVIDQVWKTAWSTDEWRCRLKNNQELVIDCKEEVRKKSKMIHFCQGTGVASGSISRNGVSAEEQTEAVLKPVWDMLNMKRTGIQDVVEYKGLKLMKEIGDRNTNWGIKPWSE